MSDVPNHLPLHYSTALLMDFLNTPEKKERRLVHVPMGRFGEAIEQAKGALFRASSSVAQVRSLVGLSC